VDWHLAQCNLGRLVAPLDDPSMDEFRLALEPVNAIAEATPGFVWRLTADDGSSSTHVDVPGTDDPLVAANLSVWEDLDSLRHYVFTSGHASYLRRRAEWFQRPDEVMTVLWWIPAGELPTLGEAVERLAHLRRHGPSERGWTLAHRFDPPG
jgi:hypothetical protein